MDYVKYQTFVPSLVASDAAPVTAYQSKTGFSGQQAMLTSFVLSDDEHQSLKRPDQIWNRIFVDRT